LPVGQQARRKTLSMHRPMSRAAKSSQMPSVGRQVPIEVAACAILSLDFPRGQFARTIG